MYIGIQDYTVKKDYYPREMGEAIPPRKPERECREYRPREIGEDPRTIPSRQQQQDNYDRARQYYSGPREPDYQTRPREIGEDPREVRNPNAPKKASEMTEQERRLDLFA